MQDANDKEMQAQIRIVTQDFVLSRCDTLQHDPSFVVGQFWIFAAIFLNDNSVHRSALLPKYRDIDCTL